jgi:hypothetical protein
MLNQTSLIIFLDLIFVIQVKKYIENIFVVKRTATFRFVFVEVSSNHILIFMLNSNKKIIIFDKNIIILNYAHAF